MGINGDSNTCFDVGYNEVYSPWSNPPLPIYNSNDSLTIEITGRNSNGSLSLNIFFTNILGASPSKPQGLKVGKNYVGGGFNPKLSWNRNLEPDLMNYIVYRGYVSSPGVEPSSYDSIANTTDTSYVDEELFLYESGSSPCYFISRYSYRISAVDNTNRKSVKSEKATIAGYYSVCDPYGDNILQQYNSNSENIIELDEFHNLNEYKLFDNYPNPFNPITKILFDLPEATSISLKIYNILGREVETLIDDNRQKGRYSILFNATNFPSGIYYYKLQTNNFTCVKKMILIK